MKFIKNSMLLLSLIFSISSLHAYKYTFDNSTDNSYLIGIRLGELNAPVYKKRVGPRKPIHFVQAKDFPSIKWSYCLDKIEYIKNPTKEQERATKNLWKTGTFLSLDKVSYKKLIEANAEEQNKLLHAFSETKKDSITTKKAGKICSDKNIQIIESITGTPYFIIEK